VFPASMGEGGEGGKCIYGDLFLSGMDIFDGRCDGCGRPDGGYHCACLRYRLCLSLHVSSVPRRLGHSEVFRWCLELVM
jgi:hypothetical protein